MKTREREREKLREREEVEEREERREKREERREKREERNLWDVFLVLAIQTRLGMTTMGESPAITHSSVNLLASSFFANSTNAKPLLSNVSGFLGMLQERERVREGEREKERVREREREKERERERKREKERERGEMR
jgi:hypothetical protein